MKTEPVSNEKEGERKETCSSSQRQRSPFRGSTRDLLLMDSLVPTECLSTSSSPHDDDRRHCYSHHDRQGWRRRLTQPSLSESSVERDRNERQKRDRKETEIVFSSQKRVD